MGADLCRCGLSLGRGAVREDFQNLSFASSVRAASPPQATLLTSTPVPCRPLYSSSITLIPLLNRLSYNGLNVADLSKDEEVVDALD